MFERVPVTTGYPESRRRVGCRSVLGLRIPVEAGRPVNLAVLRLTLSELGAAVGGGFPEGVLIAEYAGRGCVFYADARRVVRGLPVNERAVGLAARLGHHDRSVELRGDVLVLGCDGYLNEVGVPRPVVDAVAGSGLFGERA